MFGRYLGSGSRVLAGPALAVAGRSVGGFRRSVQTARCIIDAGFVIYGDPDAPSAWSADQSIVVDGSGRIAAIVATSDEEALSKFDAGERIDAKEHIVMPGLVNAHTHSPMTTMRGVGEDTPLESWLQQHIWPLEAKFADASFCHDGSALAIAEMIKGGVTMFNDQYWHAEETARVAHKAGIRAHLGLTVISVPTPYAKNVMENIDNNLKIQAEILTEAMAYQEARHGDVRVQMTWSPHAIYTVDDDALRLVKEMADDQGMRIHMHIHETEDEVAESVAATGKRPLERLDEMGLVDDKLIAVHMVHLTDDEIDGLLAPRGVHVVHCPESNCKLASGVAPVAQMLASGVNVAIGTDGVACNNDLDMLGEARTAAMLAKGTTGDATVLPAEQVLQMATLEGARALGVAHETGSLTVGKYADLITIAIDGVETVPLYNPLSLVMYSLGRHRVRDVMVGGDWLMRERNLLTLNEVEIIAKARDMGSRIGSYKRRNGIGH